LMVLIVVLAEVVALGNNSSKNICVGLEFG
jgi:hypothetical protein